MKKSRLFGAVYLFAALATLGLTGISQAGTIYTDETSFNTAVASLTQQWSEDFSGYAQGGVANPLSIAGGQAEVSGTGFTAILFPTNNEWLGSTGGPTSIQAPSSSPLGLAAISFNFGNPEAVQQVIFNLVGGGSDTSTGYAQTTCCSGPSGAPNFAGWIGGSGEQLMDVTFSQHDMMVLDNINAYVPIPAAVWLFGSGLLGLVGIARRKKAA